MDFEVQIAFRGGHRAWLRPGDAVEVWTTGYGFFLLGTLRAEVLIPEIARRVHTGRGFRPARMPARAQSPAAQAARRMKRRARKRLS